MLEYEERLRALALNDRRFVESIMSMGLDSMEASRLDPKAHAVALLAAYVAVGAAASSYHRSVEAALATGATADEIVGTLLAIIPAVGLARVVSAAADVAQALDFDLDGALEN
jgi:alkylhydroperoxidase/carboxymuconolactone decarboxylase family protein YurZ